MEKIYQNLKIESSTHLLNIEQRFACVVCSASRKFFCYKCSSAHPDFKEAVPRVELPLKIDIIRHRQEILGKSTSSHAKIIASNYVNIYEYPEIPDYSREAGEVVLIFPSTKSVSISSLFKGVSPKFKENQGLEKGFTIGTLQRLSLNDVLSDGDKKKLASDEPSSEQYSLDNLPFKRAVFIDSTWKQCRGIYKDPRINSLKSCIIQNRITKFWRKQKGSPSWYLATIEAIHQFLLEVHISAWGISQRYYNECLDDLQLDKSFIPLSRIISDETEAKNDNDIRCQPYQGQYDNILFFFSFLYSLINSLEETKRKRQSKDLTSKNNKEESK